MSLIDSNSGYTLDKTLNCTYSLRTAARNETIIVNFGDSSDQIYNISSNLKSNYLIPRYLSNATSYDQSNFLLLNTEFYDNQLLFGFELFGVNNLDHKGIFSYVPTTTTPVLTQPLNSQYYDIIGNTTSIIPQNQTQNDINFNSNITIKVKTLKIKIKKVTINRCCL